MTRAVPFGREARSKWEGGRHAEPGVKCCQCGSTASLKVLGAGVYHCAPFCYERRENPARSRMIPFWKASR